nr:twin-arginine translocation signal domain-containing protein [Angustibacter aerolatus]
MTDRRQATQSQTSDTAAVTLSGLNRRRFLGLGALAGGAALLSACGVPGADSKASGKDTGPARRARSSCSRPGTPRRRSTR